MLKQLFRRRKPRIEGNWPSIVRRDKVSEGIKVAVHYAANVDDTGRVTVWTTDRAKAVAVTEVHGQLITEHYLGRPNTGRISFEDESGKTLHVVGHGDAPTLPEIPEYTASAWSFAVGHPEDCPAVSLERGCLKLRLRRASHPSAAEIDAASVTRVHRAAADALAELPEIRRYRAAKSHLAEARARRKELAEDVARLQAERETLLLGDELPPDLPARLLEIEKQIADTEAAANAAVAPFEDLERSTRAEAEPIIRDVVEKARHAAIDHTRQLAADAQRAILELVDRGMFDDLYVGMFAEAKLAECGPGVVRSLLAE